MQLTSLDWGTASPIFSSRCIGAYSLICHSPTGTKPGNFLFRRPTSWTATPPCGPPRSTPITPSVPNLPRFCTGSRQLNSESSHGRNSRLRVCLLQFPAYAVQHSIDKLHGLGTGKLARDLQRFVDDHGARGRGKAHQLSHR